MTRTLAFVIVQIVLICGAATGQVDSIVSVCDGDPICFGEFRPEYLDLFFEIDGTPVYRYDVESDYALHWWRDFRDLHPETGYWPVILGPPDAADQVLRHRYDAIAQMPDHSTALAEVQSFDLDEWQLARRRELGVRFDGSHGESSTETGATGERERQLSEGPVYSSALPYFPDIDPGPHRSWSPTVTIALLPVAEAWESPLLLGFGEHNQRLSPTVQAATFKRWQERYGAVLIAMTDEIIELFAARPPLNRDEANELAIEQTLFRGHGDQHPPHQTLGEYLLDTQNWLFWWPRQM